MARLTEAEIVDRYGRAVGPWNVQGPPHRRLAPSDLRTPEERGKDAAMLALAIVCIIAVAVAWIAGRLA